VEVQTEVTVFDLVFDSAVVLQQRAACLILGLSVIMQKNVLRSGAMPKAMQEMLESQLM